MKEHWKCSTSLKIITAVVVVLGLSLICSKSSLFLFAAFFLLLSS